MTQLRQLHTVCARPLCGGERLGTGFEHGFVLLGLFHALFRTHRFIFVNSVSLPLSLSQI